MSRTFMATAVDLGAFEGGCGRNTYPSSLCIHPGFKSAVGARLVLGARNVALGQSSVYHSGPLFQYAEVRKEEVVVHFRGVGSGGIGVFYRELSDTIAHPRCK